MFVVLLMIHLHTGQVVPRTSVVIDKAGCEESLPLFEKLYYAGKFEDGPPADKIKRIKSKCIAVE